MSRKWWVYLIVVAVIVGVVAAVKLMPMYATLVAIGSYIFGCFSGYILKKKEVIEKIVEKPVVVTKEVVKEIPIEKIVYKEAPAEAEQQPVADAKEPTVETVATSKSKRGRKRAE